MPLIRTRISWRRGLVFTWQSKMPATRTKKARNHEVRLVLRSGRLTGDYFMLREAWMQGFRPKYYRNAKCYDSRQVWRINLMIEKGYLERSTGPRGGGYFYRATSEGAFQMMVAEGIAKARTEAFNDPKAVARRARANQRRRERLANAKVSQARSSEQEACAIQAMVP